jgi:hypothetical protein
MYSVRSSWAKPMDNKTIADKIFVSRFFIIDPFCNVIIKAVLDILVGKCKNNNEILDDMLLSTIFIGISFYEEIRVIPIPKREV